MTVRAYNIVSYGALAGIAPMCESPISWRDRAACKGNPAAFFDADRWPEARTICLGCEVRDECLDEALAEGRIDEFRAGLTPKELAKVAKVVRRPPRGSACLVCAGPSGRSNWCASCRVKAKNHRARRGVR